MNKTALAIAPKKVGAGLAVALFASLLSACDKQSADPADYPAFVRTEIVRPKARQGSVTQTGEVQARYRAELAFRVSGRVIARLVEVGAHVESGQVLARLDPSEQQADLDAATAAVEASQSQLRVATATFQRQKTLLANGFTTRVAFDQAQEGLKSAEASLEDAKAQRGKAKEALGDTELRADAAGVITARRLEAGQVVQAAQPVFSLAQDGDRDAIFEVNEEVFFGDIEGGDVSLRLLSDPNVTALGRVREVSPAIDSKSSTVRVKVAIQQPPPAMSLGSAVAGMVRLKPSAQIALPWTALMAAGDKPAVWVVDPATKTAALKPVTIAGHEAEVVLIKSGLESGERVVIDGGKVLSSGQRVAFDENPS
jgi:RND family efflux transporter MFP subunit